MLDFDYLPTVQEEDVEVEREYEVQIPQLSCQEAVMPANESQTGEDELHSLQPLPQKAVNREDESDDIIMTDEAPVEKQNGSQSSDDRELQLIEVRNLRSASKRQEKTVKTLEKSKADSVEENLVDARLRLQSCQSELKDTKDKLATSKKDLKKTKGQLTGMRKELATCRRKLQETKGVIRQMKGTNSDLQHTLEASREELSNCMDDLFSLQGVAQVPDSTITERFESLDQQIIYWIDAEVAKFEKVHPEAEPDYVFSRSEFGPVKGFLRLHPDAGEHLARYLIHRLLQEHVFRGHVYLFGLPEETARLLWEAERKLAELDPPRDSVAIASWRSETLKALDKTTKCGDGCQQQSKHLTNDLFKRLCMALPVLFSGAQAEATFYDQVLLPSVKLANTIRMSTSDYVVSIPESPVAGYKPVTIDMLKMCKMVDSKSGKYLKPDSAVIADKDGVIGKTVIYLMPGLYRVTKGKETTLHQETILVELYHPLGKRIKAST